MSSTSFDTHPIRLPDGWSGRVLTSWHDPADGGRAPQHLPNPAQWKEALGTLVSDPTVLSGYGMLKYSKTGMVLRASVPAGDATLDVVCKQTRGRGRWLIHRFADAIRPSRARRNFDRALEILGAGLNTAVPLAVIEKRFPSNEAWLVTEFIPDLVDLDHVVLQHFPRLEPQSLPRIKKGICDAIVHLLDTMQAMNLTHRDLKASNILLRVYDGQRERPSVWLVDLDGLRPIRWRKARHRWQPIVRLLASLLGCPGVTRTDFCRFLKKYLEKTNSPDGRWKPLYRELSWQAGRYLKLSQRRKVGKIDGYGGNR